MIVYISDPIKARKRNLINSFSAVAGHKINSNKSVAILDTKDKQAEEEIRESTPTIIVINKRKYLEGDSNQASERSV